MWRAKALSAWWLHKHTVTDANCIFVSYSSIAGAMGSISQSAYGAANRFLDQLMEERRASGHRAASIQWPAVSGKGMAAVSMASQLSDDSASSWSISPAQVESYLTQVLTWSHNTNVVVMPTVLLDTLGTQVELQFSSVPRGKTASPLTSTATIAVKPQSRFTAEQVATITTEAIASLLSITDFDSNVQLMDIGMDSLEAAELPMILSREFDVKLTPTLIFSHPTAASVVSYIQQLLGLIDSNKDRSMDAASSSVGYAQEQIAVAGMACRYPGGINNLTDMWEALSSGRDLTSKVSLSRWDTDEVIASKALAGEAANLESIRFGGFMTDEAVESFRASVFGISDAEASRMDPAQRLLLDVSYDALVDAGYDKEQLRGKRVGVFVGASGTFGEEGVSNDSDQISVFDATGKTLSVASGRISYCLGMGNSCISVYCIFVIVYALFYPLVVLIAS